ncbi:hypothetical protein EJ03DRAFT_351260 [Teratosphaeria nubilosa]|uniref:DUF6594 domain-containing protein n=1 Tax=Teratosphaeria nubilosa TaxID=161662 RepID=A0A6G1L9K3_9PEZI|nr:hypothetical protein EJ03DRAFT_351260 [Teratosphaeria nubilosa]
MDADVHRAIEQPASTEGAAPVPPTLAVSRAVDDIANTQRSRTLATQRRTKTAKEHGRTCSEDWTDEDESPPRRTKSDKKASSRRSERQSRSGGGSRVETSSSHGDFGRYFPRLSRILEGSDSQSSSRPSTKDPETRRRGVEATRRRHRDRNESGSVYRRPVRYKTGAVQRRSDSLFKINPSLLSVLTSLTNNSDRSSGSNSTITQQTYDRRGSNTSRTPTGRPRQSELGARSMVSVAPQSPNVFDYMISPQPRREHDMQSIMSSASSPSVSSHYEPSVAGWSEAPDTPSSRSSFPSPTSTRNASVNELRRKFDPQYASLASHSGSESPESSVRLARRTPSVKNALEDDEGRASGLSASSLSDHDSHQRWSSMSSHSSQRSAGHVKRQEERMRQHVACTNKAQHSLYVNPVYDQHRSSSEHSAHSAPPDQASFAHHMAMQHYQSSHSPGTSPTVMTQSMNGQIHQPVPPPVPDAPDLSQRTILGYEMLALELSTTQSPVQPLYRKFEYLNHRILLHLQDELGELEEQLRSIDEVIAQLDPACNDDPRTPASRRAEAYSQSEIHHRRTALLGRIFLKTEQYNKALAGYAAMLKDATPAAPNQVHEYRSWMDKHTPIHEYETRFLHHASDLVRPGQSENPRPVPPTANHAVLAYLPAALMLPLLLFSIIPSFTGRLAVTSLIAIGAFIVAATTKIRAWLEAREWAACGAGYVLVMAAVAGLVPQHGW